MIRLLIDGHDAVLPSDLSIDYFKENPFFSKNGEYSYDIDIDLNSESNRKLYASINRTDVSRRLTGRQAILLDGYRVWAIGTEVILSVEDNVAKIQIVAGNSEMNYLSGGSLRLRELDLGELSVTSSQAYSGLSSIYPDAVYCCPPIYTSYNNPEEFKFDNQMDIAEGSTTYKDGTYISPQPYLLHVLERVISALGYSISSNVLLEEERWRRLFLVNGYRTAKVAEMLPDWSVDEFLTEVEKFFNCILIVNKEDKTIEILRTDGYYSNVQRSYIGDVLEEGHKKNYEQTENTYISYKNVRYNFPELTKYKYMCLHDEVRANCSTVQMSHHWEYLNFVKSDACVIYKSLDYGLEFAGGQLVDRFAAVSDGSDDEEVLLKIIPAEIFTGMSGTDSMAVNGFFMAPFARNISSEDSTDKSAGFTELATEGVRQADVPSNLYVALYMGWQGLFVDSTEETYQYADYKLPMSTVDVFNYTASAFGVQKFKDDSLTLRLQGDHGLYNSFYSNNIKVSTRIEYTFKFLTDRVLDPKSIFVIRNKAYYCKELHYTISSKGVDKVVEGTFYLIE